MRARLFKISGLITAGTVAVIVGVSIASQSINNFDDFVYQIKEPFDGAEPEPIGISIPSQHPIVTYTGTNCSPMEILNKTCFTDALTKCTDARISKTIITIEGDPITTFALINSTNPSMCNIDMYHNTLHDRYGEQTIHHHTCSLAIGVGESLQITKCIPLEHGQEQVFEFE